MMVDGTLKFEYNYFGSISGSFKSTDSNQGIRFSKANVVQRGQTLETTRSVTCIVLNVGAHCMGSPFIDPSGHKNSSLPVKQRESMLKKYRSF